MVSSANILYTVDPENPKGPKIAVRLEQDTLQYWYKYKPTKWKNVLTAKHVLDNPLRIFVGIRRSFSENGWCYVGKPRTWFIRENEKVAFPQDLVYAVYLNDRKAIYDHIAEVADVKDLNSPEDWENRFGGVIHV